MITVLDKFDPAIHYFEDPYPHVIIEDALPEDVYKKLYDSWPVQEIKDKLAELPAVIKTSVAGSAVESI